MTTAQAITVSFLAKYVEEPDDDCVIWSVCEEGGSRWIEPRYTTTNAIGYLLIPPEVPWPPAAVGPMFAEVRP